MRNKRVKLIALVVASMFAQGSATAADNFLWGGLVDLGWRFSNIDGTERNGAYGTVGFPSTIVPFTGPRDEAKAQEYQDVDSGLIGVIDIMGGNRTYYFRGFGEELRPRRPVHQCFRRRLRGVEGVDLQRPHSAQPVVERADAAVEHGQHAALEPRRRLSAVAESGAVDDVQLRHPAQHARRRLRVLEQDAVVRPRRLQRGRADRPAPQQRRARHRVEQRPDPVRGAGRLQDQERVHRGRLQQQAVGLQARLPRQQVLERERRDAVHELLHAQRPRRAAAAARQRAQEVELQRVGQAIAVGLDAAVPLVAERAHQQPRHRVGEPQADQQRLAAAGRRLPGDGAVRRRVRATAVDVRRRAQDDDGPRVLEREPDGPARHARLLRLLRPAERVDQRVVRGGQPGEQLRDAPGQQRDVLPDRRVCWPPRRSSTRRTRRASTRPGRSRRDRSSSAASTGRRSSAISIRRRRPTSTATGSSTATAAGRRSPGASSTSTCSVARTSIPASTTTASPTSSRRPCPTTSRPTTCRTSTRTW